MDGLWTPALYALAAWNLAVALLYGWDKRLAVRGRRRVPEATLLVAAGLFAAPGAVLGMYLFRHKTKKALFRFGVPALLLCQLLAVQFAAVRHYYLYLVLHDTSFLFQKLHICSLSLRMHGV